MNSEEDLQNRKKFASSEKDVLKHIQNINLSKDNEITKQRFLVEIRDKMDKAEEELSDCLKADKSRPISSCYLDYGSRMYRLKDLIKNTKDLGKLKSFYLPCVSELVDEDTQRYINEINKISKERTSYGIREEITDKKSFILSWSNANKAWYPYGKTQENVKGGKEIYSYKAKKGMKIKLDSNQILVPIEDDKDLDKLGHAASCSSTYPLYKLSFEAVWERKETPVILGLLSWIERQKARLKEEQERKKYI